MKQPSESEEKALLEENLLNDMATRSENDIEPLLEEIGKNSPGEGVEQERVPLQPLSVNYLIRIKQTIDKFTKRLGFSIKDLREIHRSDRDKSFIVRQNEGFAQFFEYCLKRASSPRGVYLESPGDHPSFIGGFSGPIINFTLFDQAIAKNGFYFTVDPTDEDKYTCNLFVSHPLEENLHKNIDFQFDLTVGDDKNVQEVAATIVKKLEGLKFDLLKELKQTAASDQLDKIKDDYKLFDVFYNSSFKLEKDSDLFYFTFDGKRYPLDLTLPLTDIIQSIEKEIVKASQLKLSEYSHGKVAIKSTHSPRQYEVSWTDEWSIKPSGSANSRSFSTLKEAKAFIQKRQLDHLIKNSDMLTDRHPAEPGKIVVDLEKNALIISPSFFREELSANSKDVSISLNLNDLNYVDLDRTLNDYVEQFRLLKEDSTLILPFDDSRSVRFDQTIIERLGETWLLTKQIPRSNPLKTVSISLTNLEELKEAKVNLDRKIKLSVELSSIKLANKVAEEISQSSKVNIPPLAEGSHTDLDCLLDFFDGINFDDSARPGYHRPDKLTNDGAPVSVSDLRKGLSQLIKSVKERSPTVVAVPKNDPDKTIFYDELESLLRHSLKHFEEKLQVAQEEDKQATLEEIHSFVLTLAEAGLHCGVRWQTEAKQLYTNLIGGWEKEIAQVDLKNYLQLQFDELKIGIAESMALESSGMVDDDRGWSYDVSHGLTFILKSLVAGKIGLPQAQTDLDDVFERLGTAGKYKTKEQVIAEFKRRFFTETLEVIEPKLNQWLQSQTRDVVLQALYDTISQEAVFTDQTRVYESNKERLQALIDQPSLEPALTVEEQELLALVFKMSTKDFVIWKMKNKDDHKKLMALTTNNPVELEERKISLIKGELSAYIKDLKNNSKRSLEEKIKLVNEKKIELQQKFASRQIVGRSFQSQLDALTERYQATINQSYQDALVERKLLERLEDSQGERLELTAAGIEALLIKYGMADKD